MSEKRTNMKIREDKLGEVRIADDVVAIIAALAAMEVEGVTSMNGNITNEIVSRLGRNNLSKGIKLNVDGNRITIDVAINIGYGYEIPKVSQAVQEKVISAVENMTGLEVPAVNVRIANVDMVNQKKA